MRWVLLAAVAGLLGGLLLWEPRAAPPPPSPRSALPERSRGPVRSADGSTSLTMSGSAEQQLTEPFLLAHLRDAAANDPAHALVLADEYERRFPSGANLDEAVFLRVRALVNLNRPGDMHAEAGRFYERFPDSRFTQQLFQLTGYAPRPRPGGQNLPHADP